MNNKNILFVSFIFLIFVIGNVSAYSSFTSSSSSVRLINTQTYPSLNTLYSSSDINTYWPIIDNDGQCRARQDVLLQIAPAGCQPAVVRTDLLGDQNVPVLCQIQALQINPLIDIKSIDSMTFSGRYPKEVATTGYYPAQAALSTGRVLTNNALINNAGYVVVVLKRNQNESSLPEDVTLNLTARIRYDAYNALGVGQASFILNEQTETQFNNASFKNTFWQGRYSIRADTIDADSATIALYYQDRKISTLRVERGKQSQEIYIPGFSTCQASLRIEYNGFESSGSDRARIEVQDGDKKTDVFDVYESSVFANGKCRVTGNIVSNKDGTGSMSVSCSGERTTLSLTNLKNTDQNNDESKLSQDDKAYLAQVRTAISEYRKVAEIYPAEKPSADKSVHYGEQAIQNALDLIISSSKSNYLKQEYTDLLALYKSKYSDSKEKIDSYAKQTDKIQNINSENAAATFQIDNKFVTVKVLNFIPAQKESKVKFNVGGKEIEYVAGRADTTVNGNVVTFLSADKKITYRFTVTKVNADEVTISADCPGFQTSRQTEVLSEREQATVCGVNVRVDDIDAEKLARVRIIPKVDNTQTETNLTVKIGIEKRAIQLSPEKATEMVNSLNESIKKFESISNKLNSATKSLKSACFATAAALTAKNFLSGLDGTALARKQVMNGPDGNGGWTAICTEAFKSQRTVNPSATATNNLLVSEGTPYVSVDDCFRKNAERINKDVNVAKTAVNDKINANIKNIEDSKDVSRDTEFGGKIVNGDKSANLYLDSLNKNYASDSKIRSLVKSIDEEIYGKDGKQNAYDAGVVSYEDLKSIEYNNLILSNTESSSVQKIAAQQKLEKLNSNLKESLQTAATVAEASKNAKNIDPFLQVDFIAAKENKPGSYFGAKYLETGKEITGLNANKKGKAYGKVILSNNKAYIVFLSGTSKFSKTQREVTEAYECNDLQCTSVKQEKVDSATLLEIQRTYPTFIEYNSESFRNKYLNPEVRYFNSEPYKGRPALVPIDLDEGWYVATQQILPVLGQQGTYQSSGQAASYRICNVWEGGIEEFDKYISGAGNDKCVLFNPYTGQVPEISGLDKTKAQQLVNKAERLLTQAAQKYSSGVSKISLPVSSNGNTVTLDVKNQINVPSVRCQDYMSPGECQFLFNVCDPVICPTSRCNLGGQYYVANVPETGIVGSALLCLPNAKDGIAIPVCLTGLASGVDGFVSVMQSHRDCLQEQLETGRTVGICDQIYSVYMCEFFWRQVAPVANVLLPKLVENAYGQGSKGGGEYLTVMESWKNTQDSINYFTQEYAVNSIQAFKVRSVEEAGGEFCKAFASIKAPSSFDSLVEPDSPPQFHAWFSSIKYSDATVPATSQYKVYYHIFAGQDTGVSYQVYLKNPSTVSVVSVPQQVLIATDFIARGQYASETKDFTAPEGYKELCVNVNGREECGFGQVSTSFALNYLSDKTRADTLTSTDIKTARECVSGSIGQGVTLNPNLQATAESIANPAIYNQGIIRVCASDNPGSTSSPGRYVKVGYCDNQNEGCWLDTESTARAITQGNNGTKTQVTETLDKLEQTNDLALLQASGNILTDEGYTDKISMFKEDLNNINYKLSTSQNIKDDSAILLNDIDITAAKVYKGDQKAELQLLRGDVQKALAGVLSLSLTKKEQGDDIPRDLSTETKATANPIDLKTPEAMVLEGYFVNNKEILKGNIDKVLLEKAKDGKLIFVHDSSTTYNSAFLGLDREAWYFALGDGDYTPLPIYTDEDPAQSDKQSIDVFMQDKNMGFYTSKKVGLLLKVADPSNKNQYAWRIQFNPDKNSKELLDNIKLIDGKTISLNVITSEKLSSPEIVQTPTLSQGKIEYNKVGKDIVIELENGGFTTSNLEYKFNGNSWEVRADFSENFMPVENSKFDGEPDLVSEYQYIELTLIKLLRNSDFYSGVLTLSNGVKSYGKDSDLITNGHVISYEFIYNTGVSFSKRIVDAVLAANNKNIPSVKQEEI